MEFTLVVWIIDVVTLVAWIIDVVVMVVVMYDSRIFACMYACV